MSKKTIGILLRFLIALSIPTAVFCVVANVIPMLSTDETHTFIGIFVIIVSTIVLLSVAVATATATTTKTDNTPIDIEVIWIGFIAIIVLTLLGHVFLGVPGQNVFGWYFNVAQEDGEFLVNIVLIYGWALSVLVWIFCLYEELKKARPDLFKSEEKGDSNLLGGWYILGGNSFFPVLAFEEGRKVTFTDGEIIKEFKYHICCNTCLILTAEDGEKASIKRSWFDNVPHLFYNDLEFVKR